MPRNYSKQTKIGSSLKLGHSSAVFHTDGESPDSTTESFEVDGTKIYFIVS